jgi:hypothetical protein
METGGAFGPMEVVDYTQSDQLDSPARGFSCWMAGAAPPSSAALRAARGAFVVGGPE